MIRDPSTLDKPDAEPYVGIVQECGCKLCKTALCVVALWNASDEALDDYVYALGETIDGSADNPSS